MANKINVDELLVVTLLIRAIRYSFERDNGIAVSRLEGDIDEILPLISNENRNYAITRFRQEIENGLVFHGDLLNKEVKDKEDWAKIYERLGENL